MLYLSSTTSDLFVQTQKDEVDHEKPNVLAHDLFLMFPVA